MCVNLWNLQRSQQLSKLPKFVFGATAAASEEKTNSSTLMSDSALALVQQLPHTLATNNLQLATCTTLACSLSRTTNIWLTFSSFDACCSVFFGVFFFCPHFGALKCKFGQIKVNGPCEWQQKTKKKNRNSLLLLLLLVSMCNGKWLLLPCFFFRLFLYIFVLFFLRGLLFKSFVLASAAISMNKFIFFYFAQFARVLTPVAVDWRKKVAKTKKCCCRQEARDKFHAKDNAKDQRLWLWRASVARIWPSSLWIIALFFFF